jgi:hypothetical protein
MDIIQTSVALKTLKYTGPTWLQLRQGVEMCIYKSKGINGTSIIPEPLGTFSKKNSYQHFLPIVCIK